MECGELGTWWASSHDKSDIFGGELGLQTGRKKRGRGWGYVFGYLGRGKFKLDNITVGGLVDSSDDRPRDEEADEEGHGGGAEGGDHDPRDAEDEGPCADQGQASHPRLHLPPAPNSHCKASLWMVERWLVAGRTVRNMTRYKPDIHQ